ncbi:MAG: hypothetical protein IJT44_00760 [Clostridia bacterium]|nr:hypothetical protein [Clostridia bacterium]
MDISIDNIGQLLSSLSDEEFQSLRDTAQSLLSGNAAAPPPNAPQDETAIDPQMMAKLGRLMRAMRRGEDERSALIGALKPYLSAPRRKRADEVMQMLRLVDLLPMLKEEK